MIKHKISNYRTEEGQFMTSWIQLNILGKEFYFSKKTINLNNKKPDDVSSDNFEINDRVVDKISDSINLKELVTF